MGRSTALYITRRVVKALVELAPVIKWFTNERLNEVWEGFESMSTFPKVIGAIDGTHINIPAPKDHPESYVNRKGHHSIQLQVCISPFSFSIVLYIYTVRKYVYINCLSLNFM